MFLTRFRVNTARAGARRLLSSPQRLHAAVMMSFAEPPPRDGSGPRVLWRLDSDTKAKLLLYIVSPARPDLTHLVEQAGWPTSPAAGWDTYGYGGFLATLTEGDIWAFRLTANPVHNIRLRAGEQTKRTAHLTPRHQTRWLLDRQLRAGFNVVEKTIEHRLLPEGDEHELIVHKQRGLLFTKQEEDSGKQNHVSLTTATYEGRLRITDPDALRRTLTSGLGKAKAYGCGLMTLAPVR
ncbi:type I-E CRISPR-associated protein Cas6/Cse3/CasE [Streptomyces sp. AK02-01A]|uniref:type I-E CRISPR-associated protein Cas6/Cse3/CasE n=1 Tax=Streptomyces sp. AK02-01A TaxID=3028648 RepID=UPI0029B1724A|nr:type I-E CRISPR-associated protein Cas6/Cse3/CasE [Streptomyces sp. AK02-01A]MDX3851328.1 type I-E CRISPR-associated protein Cas6/Cse3/CasE [Streptomyces sp. AK02-01A]